MLDAINNVIKLQHYAIKNVVGHTFNFSVYKRLEGFVYKYALVHTV